MRDTHKTGWIKVKSARVKVVRESCGKKAGGGLDSGRFGRGQPRSRVQMKLTQHIFFEDFSASARKALVERAEEVTRSDPSILFDEGDPSDSIYLVLEGELQLSKSSGGDQQVPIALAHAGDYFGELGVLDGSPRSARAANRDPVRLARIPGPALMEILRREPAPVALRLFARILDYVRTTTDRFVGEVLRKEKFHLIGEMAGMIIHDFRSPMTAIQLSAKLISSTHHDAGTQNKCAIITEQTQRMGAMVQELLDFARGDLVLKPEVVSMGDLFTQFQKLNQGVWMKSGVQVTFQTVESRIALDVARMQRVFQNLAANAVEAMGKTGGRLDFAAREDGAWLEILVRDTGPGIPEKIRNQFFQPFVTHGKRNGTGLGMAIVKTTIEAHRGHISFETATGKGTSFCIRLPRSQEVAIAEG